MSAISRDLQSKMTATDKQLSNWWNHEIAATMEAFSEWIELLLDLVEACQLCIVFPFWYTTISTSPLSVPSFVEPFIYIWKSKKPLRKIVSATVASCCGVVRDLAVVVSRFRPTQSCFVSSSTPSFFAFSTCCLCNHESLWFCKKYLEIPFSSIFSLYSSGCRLMKSTSSAYKMYCAYKFFFDFFQRCFMVN